MSQYIACSTGDQVAFERLLEIRISGKRRCRTIYIAERCALDFDKDIDDIYRRQVNIASILDVELVVDRLAGIWIAITVCIIPKVCIRGRVNGRLDDLDCRHRDKSNAVFERTGYDLAGTNKELPTLLPIGVKQIRAVVAGGAVNLPFIVRKNFEKRVRNAAFYSQVPCFAGIANCQDRCKAIGKCTRAVINRVSV